VSKKIGAQRKGIRGYARSWQDEQASLVFDSGACNRHRRKFHSKVSKISKWYEKKSVEQIYLFSWAYTQKISAIATPIGSAVAHPIEISRQTKIARNFGYIANKTLITPIGRYSRKVKKDNSKSCVYWFSQTRLRNIILELRHHDKTRMPRLKYIMKVRPQDPSCVAQYTHMDALCWYVSVSTTQRKILVDALGTLRTTRIHSL
jgi:hypothetical protein